MGAVSRSRHLSRMLAGSRGATPHGPVERRRHRAAGRLCQPARRRAVDHRRLDQPAQLCRPDPLEPGVLPTCSGVLIFALFRTRPRMTAFGAVLTPHSWPCAEKRVLERAGSEIEEGSETW